VTVPEPVELWGSSRQTALRMLAYDAAGSGGASVVVLHGLGTSVDVLRQAVPGLDPYRRLAEEGFNVLGLDWPGHGRSGGRRGHLTYRLAMEAAATALDRARDRWGGPCGLLGTALGGVLAFYAALEDGTASAVVCHTVLDLRDVRPVLQRARQGALLPVAAWLLRRLRPGQQARVTIPASAVVATSDLAASPALARALRRHPQAVRRYDLAGLGSILLSPEDKPDIAAATAPVLVAVGTNDRVLPETATRHFVSRLACPHELWVLPGGGHQLLLEHPEAFVPRAAEFLEKHLGALSPPP
jgi:alpha-beta hydrolase superfamily lysophospholipase